MLTLSVRAKIIVALLVATVIPLFAVGLYSVVVTEKALIETTTDAMRHDAERHGARIQASVTALRRNLIFLSRVPPVSGLIRSRDGQGRDIEEDSSEVQWLKRIHEIFAVFGRAHRGYLSARFVNEHGDPVAQVDFGQDGEPAIIGDAQPGREKGARYFVEAMKLKASEVFVSRLEPPLDAGPQELSVMTFATPVFDQQGRPRGVIATTVTAFSVLGELLERDRPHMVHLLIDQYGDYLYRSFGLDRSFVGERPRHLNQDRPELAVALKGAQGSALLLNVDGWVATYATIFPDPADSSRRWYVVEIEPRARITGILRDFEKLLLLLFLGTPLAAIGTGFWLARNWLIQPIRRMAEAIGRVGQGDLAARIPVRGSDEFSTLASAFNATAEALERLQGHLEQRVEERTARLTESEGRARAVLDNTLDAIVIIDPAGPIDSLNPAAARMFGYPENELAGTDANSLLAEGGIVKRVPNAGLATLARKPDGDREVIGRRKDGSSFIMEMAITEMVVGIQRKLLLVARDVSDRKQSAQRLAVQAEELRRSNSELEQFAYVASHDLQEPLRKIVAFGDRLRTRFPGELSEEGRDYLARMQDAAVRMRQLIDDLLTYSRITTRGQPFQSIALGQSVSEALSDLEQHIEDTRAIITVGELPLIEADPRQMHQLFQNLIANALKYHRVGEAPIVRIVATQPEQMGQVEIRVIDNGIGFDEKYLDRIFMPFQRLHSRSEFEGTGIGLAICEKIVQRHFGKITAFSKPGEGAIFVVRLPLEQPLRQQQQQQQEMVAS